VCGGVCRIGVRFAWDQSYAFDTTIARKYTLQFALVNVLAQVADEDCSRTKCRPIACYFWLVTVAQISRKVSIVVVVVVQVVVVVVVQVVVGFGLVRQYHNAHERINI
jgi:hypothetical protein